MKLRSDLNQVQKRKRLPLLLPERYDFLIYIVYR